MFAFSQKGKQLSKMWEVNPNLNPLGKLLQLPGEPHTAFKTKARGDPEVKSKSDCDYG